MTSGQRAVFLDRDGVINQLVVRSLRQVSPRHPNDFLLFPWTIEALTILADHMFTLVVVTNQPDIGRGLMTQSHLDEMHAMLRAVTPIEHIYVCDHDSTQGCQCRKPLPGLIYRASNELGIDIAQSWMIGDQKSDIEAGRHAGAKLIQVMGNGDLDTAPDVLCQPNLATAARHIVDCLLSK